MRCHSELGRAVERARLPFRTAPSMPPLGAAPAPSTSMPSSDRGGAVAFTRASGARFAATGATRAAAAAASSAAVTPIAPLLQSGRSCTLEPAPQL